MRIYAFVVGALGVSALGLYGLTWVDEIDSWVLAFLFGTVCFTVPTVVWLLFVAALNRW